MNGNDGIRATKDGRRRRSWPPNTLLALGAWLVVSPLVLSTTRVTAGMFSAITSGLALVVLAGLLTLALAGAVLVTARRWRPRSAPSTGTEHSRHAQAADEQR